MTCDQQFANPNSRNRTPSSICIEHNLTEELLSTPYVYLTDSRCRPFGWRQSRLNSNANVLDDIDLILIRRIEELSHRLFASGNEGFPIGLQLFPDFSIEIACPFESNDSACS